MTNDIAEFKFGARILLQVDLEGHSAWIINASSMPAVSEARMNFAKTLNESMRRHNFNLLSWKGDGGVYHSESEGKANFDFAINAARNVANDFNAWRTKSHDRSNLRLRISLHHAPDVYIHDTNDYWTSDHLNVFLKYEREIGVSGTIAVTQFIYKQLSTKEQTYFPSNAVRYRKFGVRPGEAIISETHYAPLKHEAILNRDSKMGFFEWLKMTLPEATAEGSALGSSSNFRASLGDASFLFAAPHPESPLSIEFLQRERFPEPNLTKEEHQQWTAKQAGLHRDGSKVSVLQIVRPLTDIPLARIEYHIESWIRARAFHLLLAENASLRNRLGRTVLDVQESDFTHPNIACCHVIVSTADEGSPQVLLCQRQRKGHGDAYYPGCWSISFEEQLRPNESVETCVLRGLAEELLGDQGISGATIQVLGAVIEKSILNPAIIVLVNVPLSLQQIANAWRHAVDKDEHRQLAGIALTPSILKKLANSSSIPAEVSKFIRPATSDISNIFSSNVIWDLHPTAVARAAMYLWSQGKS